MDSISLYFQIITSLILLAHSVTETKDCGNWGEWQAIEGERARRQIFEDYKPRDAYAYDHDSNLLLNAGFQRNPKITSSTVKLSFYGKNVTLFVQVCQPEESKCTPIFGNVTLRLDIFGKSDMSCIIEPAPNPSGFMCRTAVWPLIHGPEENLLMQFAGVNDPTSCKLTVKLFTETMGLANCVIIWEKEFIRDYTGIPLGAQKDNRETITITSVYETQETEEEQENADKGDKTDSDYEYKHGVDLNARLGLGLSGSIGAGFKQTFGYDYTTAGSKERNRRMSSIRDKINYFEHHKTQITTLTINFGTGLKYEMERMVVDCGAFRYKVGDTMRIIGSFSDGRVYNATPGSSGNSSVAPSNGCQRAGEIIKDECDDDDCGVASLHCHGWLISIGVWLSIFIGLIARSLPS